MNTMGDGQVRSLTADERASLSPGFMSALAAAGAFPLIVSAASPLARVARIWRGHVPVVTLGDRVFWPEAPADAAGWANGMALLQHELQHVLDYATGAMTGLSYACNPANWTYDLPAGPLDWRRLGAEQRAVAAEQLWRAEHQGDHVEAERCRCAIPWARWPAHLGAAPG